MKKRTLQSLAILVFFLVPGLARATEVIPLTVTEVASADQAAAAGIQAGDLLQAWRIKGEEKNTTLRSPLGIEDLERRLAFVHSLELIGSRDGKAMTWTLTPGRMNLKLEPSWPGEWQGKAAALGEAGPELWANTLSLAGELKEAGQEELSAWLLLSTFEAWAGAGEQEATVYLQALQALQSRFPLDGPAVSTMCFIATASQGSMFLQDPDWGMTLVKAAQDSELAKADPLWSIHLILEEAQLLQRKGDPKANDLFDQLVSRQEQHTPGTLAVANRYAQRGIHYYMQRNLPKVSEDWTTALEIRQKLHPGSMDVAKSHNNLGSVFWYLGDLDKAAEHFEGAMAIFGKMVPDGIGTGNGFNNLGLVHHTRGDLAKAEGYYRQALEIYRNHEHGHTMLPVALSNTAHLMRDRGNLAGAEVLLLEAKSKLNKAEKDPMLEPTLLGNLSQLEQIRGNLERARAYLEESAAMVRERTGDSADMAETLGALAQVVGEQGHLEEAIALMQEALELHQKNDQGSTRHANHMASLAELLEQTGEGEAAMDLVTQSLAIYEAKAPDSPAMAQVMVQQGSLLCAAGELEQAEAQFSAGLAILRDLTPDTWLLAQSLHQFALCLRDQGQKPRALLLLTEAVEVLEAQQKTLGGGTDAGVLFRASFMALYQDLEDLLLESGQQDAAFEILERSRARSFLSMLTERDILFDRDVPPELDEKRRRLHVLHDQALKELSALTRETPEEQRQAARAKLEDLKAQQQEVVLQIRKASPRLAALRYPEPLSREQAGQSLKAGDCFVAYSVAPEKVRAYVMGPALGDFEVYELKVNSADLRNRVEAFRGLKPQAGSEELERLSAGLSDLLLAPFAEQIKKAKRLVISADGPLHVLPFAALKDPSDPGTFSYLIERLPLSLVQSGTTLAQLRSEAAGVLGEGAVFADPDYTQAELATEQLGALPMTRREANLIRKIKPAKTQLFLGSEASESNAKEVGTQKGWVHFACHGILDPESPLDSGLALTNPGKLNAPGDNGLLQAWEVFEGLRFKANLVTLSACETGLGPVMVGEGLNSLARAFQYAGARSVMASLWRVEDRSTQNLMSHFYGKLEKGAPMDQALQQAQIELIRERSTRRGDGPPTGGYSHPFYWAGFTLIGDSSR